MAIDTIIHQNQLFEKSQSNIYLMNFILFYLVHCIYVAIGQKWNDIHKIVSILEKNSKKFFL